MERKEMTQFNEKVALVTGSGSGIGRTTAQFYAREGAKVVVSDIDMDGGEETVEMIKADGGEAVLIRADVSRPEDCESLVQSTEEQFGRLDFACNNAGIAGEQNPTADYSVEGWQKLISINLSGVFYCMKYEIPAMLENGGGSIVNIASILGKVGFSGAPAYVTSKHGVVGLTQNTAVEYGQSGIRVNAVGPGFIHTPLIAELEEDQETKEQLVALHPIGRLGKPEEVAELVIWLSSEKASFITGSYYPIDGGYLAR
jgi:NAD(P)-dependent dehydrogenase (short-subunit alcohol dehydrogenase family)